MACFPSLLSVRLKSGSSSMRKFFCVAFLLFFLITLHTPAWAAELVVGISTGYPPYYYNEGSRHTGICVNLVNAVAKKMGLEVTYKVFPWKRLLLNAEKGDVDAIMPLFRTTAEYQKLKEKYSISEEDSGKVEVKLILAGSNE